MLSVQDGFLELWSASRMSASKKSDSAKGQYEGRKPVRASGSWAATTEAAEAQYGQGGRQLPVHRVCMLRERILSHDAVVVYYSTDV
jgi:hypothetical protein